MSKRIGACGMSPTAKKTNERPSVNCDTSSEGSEMRRTHSKSPCFLGGTLLVVMSVTTVTVGMSGCRAEEAGKPDSIASAAWDAEAQKRRAVIDRVIDQHRLNFDAFDSGSLGDATLEMIPFVVFRVLQELEPTAFGDEALASVGFFSRTDTPSHRHGVTWTRPTSPDDSFEVRYMTRTCASCHTGRVRLADGTMRLLHGNANTEMNVHLFIGRLTSVLKERLSTSNDTDAYQAFRKRIIEALRGKSPTWFWGADSTSISATEAEKEVSVVISNIDAILTTMRQMNDRRLAGLNLLRVHSYQNVPNPPSLVAGAPGLVETSGLGSASLVRFVDPSQIRTVLPPGPSKADIPAVWKIEPQGYANWDATIVGFARSLTSSMAVVGNPEKIDLKNNALIQDFLGKLPPEPYPFAIDQAARARGEVTFKKNCVGCHDPSPGRNRDDLIFDVGTDPLRADAITPTTVTLMGKVIRAVCAPTQPECDFGDSDPLVDPSSKRGYVASALHGIWAQAPYLHNGSVPTLRQLLVPALRTNEPFLRGSVSYHRQDGGWEWEPSKQEALLNRGETAIAIHDIREAGFSNIGHGAVADPFVDDGRGGKVRISWSNQKADKATVDDLIAYLLSL